MLTRRYDLFQEQEWSASSDASCYDNANDTCKCHLEPDQHRSRPTVYDLTYFARRYIFLISYMVWRDSGAVLEGSVGCTPADNSEHLVEVSPIDSSRERR